MNRAVLIIVGMAAVLGILWYGGVFESKSPNGQDTLSAEQSKTDEGEATDPAASSSPGDTAEATATEGSAEQMVTAETPATAPAATSTEESKESTPEAAAPESNPKEEKSSKTKP